MPQKLYLNQVTDENKGFIKSIEREKAKAFILPFLCMVLLLIELSLSVFLEVDTFIIIICTFVLSFLVNTYVLYKLSKTKILLQTVLTANHNEITVRELINTNEKKFNQLEWVKISWRSFITEYIMVGISCFVCVGIPFVSFISKFN